MTTLFTPLLQGAAALLNPELQPAVGVLSAAETGADTAAFSGAAPVSGALSATEAGADTVAFAGALPIVGALSVTETGADTLAAAGTVTPLEVTGALDAAETGSDTLAAVGAVPIVGALSASDAGADTAEFAGATPISGALNAADAGADTLVAAGELPVSGALSADEAGADSPEFAGEVPVAGALDATDTGEDVLAAEGQVTNAGDHFGALDATETGADSAAFAGVYAAQTIHGSLVAREFLPEDRASFVIQAQLRSPEEQASGLFTFYAWSFWAKHFDAIRQVALQQPTELVRSGYYRTLFSVESFNEAMASITAGRILNLGIPASVAPVAEKKRPERRPVTLKAVSSVPDKEERSSLETGVPGVAARSERWAPDPAAERVARAVDTLAAEARRAQRVFHLERVGASRAKVADLAQEQARVRLARRRKAAAMLLLAA